MEKFKTMSDVGSVLVGSKDFGICLTNGIGDGLTAVVVLDNTDSQETSKTALAGAKFNTVVMGKFNIYNYDCSLREDKDIMATLEGRYGVYYNDNTATVIFEKWQ